MSKKNMKQLFGTQNNNGVHAFLTHCLVSHWQKIRVNLCMGLKNCSPGKFACIGKFSSYNNGDEFEMVQFTFFSEI